jgi:hypothetical protein
MNIGRPAAVSMALGVADGMAELQGFPAQIALQFSISLIIM